MVEDSKEYGLYETTLTSLANSKNEEELKALHNEIKNKHPEVCALVDFWVHRILLNSEMKFTSVEQSYKKLEERLALLEGKAFITSYEKPN